MKYSLDVKSSAEIGVLKAFDYYEDKQKGLGDRFLDYWETHLDMILQEPLMFQVKYKDFRQALIKPYPYHIIYEVEGNIITVYKVIYAGRRPSKRFKKK